MPYSIWKLKPVSDKCDFTDYEVMSHRETSLQRDNNWAIDLLWQNNVGHMATHGWVVQVAKATGLVLDHQKFRSRM